MHFYENVSGMVGFFCVRPSWRKFEGHILANVELLQESKKVTTHPDIVHPRQSPSTMKGFPLQPVGNGLGVCYKGVLKQP